MKEPPPLVDIHCHLLPGIDDGAADWDQTSVMAETAVADGISTIVATPHQLGNFARNHGDAIREHTARVQQFLDRRGITLRVLPGAEVRIEPEMIRKLHSGEVLTLADRRRHVLLELPHEVYLPLDRLIDTLRAAGLVGILSHPERNRGVLARPHVVAPLVDAGCLMQVTAGSLVGTFGPQIEKFAHALIRRRLVHFVATDAHGAKSRRPLLRRSFDCVARLAGYETAVDLCCHNPAAVADGKDVTTNSDNGWFRWKKAG